MNWITRYLSINYPFQDEFVLFRIRLLAVFLLITITCNLVYIIIFSTLLHTNIPLSVFFIGTFYYSSLLMLMRFGVNLTLISQLMLVMVFIAITGASYFSGGSRSFVLPWLSFLPVLSVLLLNFRSTVIWFLVILVTLFALGFADPWLPVMKYTDDPWRGMMAVTGLCVLLFYFTSLFDSGRYKILNILKEKNDELEANQNTIKGKNVELQLQKKVIEDYSKTLEDRVHERTLDLELKNKQLAEYAFINSHLLRAPLSNILGLVNILEKTELTTKEQEVVVMLKEASTQLDDVVSRINKAIDENTPLDRARIETPFSKNP
jgi:signal transduction histidine kinase